MNKEYVSHKKSYNSMSNPHGFNFAVLVFYDLIQSSN